MAKKRIHTTALSFRTNGGTADLLVKHSDRLNCNVADIIRDAVNEKLMVLEKNKNGSARGWLTAGRH